MQILAIETSCDDSAISVISASGSLKNNGKNLSFNIEKNIISSQIKVHQPYGGVVPNLAKREHIANLPKIYKNISKEINLAEIDLIAVTVGPGLEPALWAGINFAIEVGKNLNKPIIGVNHLEGHLYSFLLPSQQKAVNSKKQILNSKKQNTEFNSCNLEFPATTLLVSGGHTMVIQSQSLTEYKKLGQTRDDAAGEAFDKVGKMLGLKYPGGPEIERLAKKGNPKAIQFPRPMIHEKNYEFSFSGLKTSVLYYLRDNKKIKKQDIAASFQQSVIDILIKKTISAASEFNSKSIFLCGGVAANTQLREQLKSSATENNLDFYVPEAIFNTDNAAMIAVSGYINHLQEKQYPFKADGNLNLN